MNFDLDKRATSSNPWTLCLGYTAFCIASEHHTHANRMIRTNMMMLVMMMAIVACAVALPSQNPAGGSGLNSTTSKPIKLPSNRQARADFTSLARFLTPDNLAQMKSLFSGFGYGGLSNALAFNVGNLIIVTLLAGVALLLAPTILGLFGIGAVGTNIGRSLGITNEDGRLVDAEKMYRAMDSFFQDYNIDARTCLQRFSCAASRQSSSAVRGGNPSYLDSALNFLLESSYVTTVLDKTSMLQAVNFGKAGGDCEIEYGKCPFSWEKVSNALPFKGFQFPTFPFFASASTVPPMSASNNSKLPQASVNQ